MRILVITRASWRNDNNIGNTLSDLFSNVSADIYSLCFRDETPQNTISKSNFAISEGQLVKHLKNKNYIVGKENEISVDIASKENDMYSAAKKAGSVYSVFLKFAREILWSLGGYKSESLKAYINKVNPEIIFMPVFNCYYPHKVLRYIHSLTDAKIVLFHADDNYSLKQFSLNPFYWIYRLGLRRNVKKSVAISNMNYVISALQKAEYEKAFKRECKILTKSGYFDKNVCFEKEENKPLEIVYTGNLSVGRWKTLALVTDALKSINRDSTKAVMKIYSFSNLSEKQKNKLADGKNTIFCGGIKPEEVVNTQKRADILIYPESFSFKEKLEVRQSFSTKIVDYLGSANPIFAVGPKDIASISYFIENNCALVASNKNEIESKLIEFLENKELRVNLAKKAYECGSENHQRDIMQRKLCNELVNTLNN